MADQREVGGRSARGARGGRPKERPAGGILTQPQGAATNREARGAAGLSASPLSHARARVERRDSLDAGRPRFHDLGLERVHREHPGEVLPTLALRELPAPAQPLRVPQERVGRLRAQVLRPRDARALDARAARPATEQVGIPRQEGQRAGRRQEGWLPRAQVRAAAPPEERALSDLADEQATVAHDVPGAAAERGVHVRPGQERRRRARSEETAVHAPAAELRRDAVAHGRVGPVRAGPRARAAQNGHAIRAWRSHADRCRARRRTGGAGVLLCSRRQRAVPERRRDAARAGPERGGRGRQGGWPGGPEERDGQAGEADQGATASEHGR
mmetsp:Transcript_15171/g.47644  ORF Transcript_15171/g.47644 Transcript_15171/m.47644 type:complete len:330 (+) Transcript_15171:113-1102(+)